MIKDCDGREWRTHINVALALSDLIGSGLTERVMDGFAGLDGRIDINNLRELCRQIGKSSMASDQSLTIEFLCPVLPAGYERGLASEPLVSYNVCNRRRSIRQSFRTRLPTRCQYAKGDRCTHAQHIDIEIALQSSKPTSVAVLHKIVERFANCSMYGLLKLDEALELPVECDGTEKYVQTIAEEIYIQLRARASVQGAYVQCESAESVHNYRGVGQVSDLEWSSDNLYLNDSKDY
ncbi:MAG: GTP cyclohydrolase, FolE2/MptA family [Pseudomonadales bacterium]